MKLLLVVLLAYFKIVNGVPVALENVEEGDYFQGDILPDPNTPIGFAGMKDTRRRWPDSTVVYSIDSKLSDTELTTLQLAMRDIRQNSCILFKERGQNEKAFVSITRDKSGCYSNLGRTGGKQALNLGNGCWRKGTVIHELLHTIGFHHEQSRPDRDDYVTISFDNIQRGREPNFNKLSSSQVDTFGVSYDYGSVLHYPATAFAIDYSKPTIITKQAGVRIGQRDGLSSKDIEKLNKMYGCKI